MKIWLVVVLLCLSGQLQAYCEGNRYPNISVATELAQSDFVVVGQVTSRRIVVDPQEDPQGYEAEIFQVNVEAVLHGHPPQYVTRQYLILFNSNGSSRFVMTVGEKYLLFVSSGADGFWINSCGNSSELAGSEKTMRLLKQALARRAKSAQKPVVAPPRR